MTEYTSDPSAYVRIFWRWKFLFLAIVVGVPLVVYLVVSRQPTMYQSSTLVNIQPGAVDTSLFTLPTNATQTQSLEAVARIITTPAIARAAAPRLKPRATNPTALLSQVTSVADQTTGFITITAQDSSPFRAASIAQAFATAAAANRTRDAKARLDVAIAQVRSQLLSLPRGYPARQQLAEQLASLQALRASQGAGSQVVQAATPSNSPSSPRTMRATLLALIAGLLLGLGAVLVAQAADRRLRQPEEVEQLTGLPLLGIIPRTGFSKQPHRADDEAFQMLRSSIMYFNIDKPLSSVLITSPRKGEGKTTVATRLALALARAGRDVILLDADLRRPMVANRLGLDPAGNGLAQLLSGRDELDTSLTEYPLGDQIGVGSLRVLPAGAPPPNPSELLGSQRMRGLLSELETKADVVVIDTTPLLSVSDSLPLLDAVSGVVLIARLNRTTTHAMRRLQVTIANATGTMLGVVATGAVGGIFGRYGYGYGYGYKANGKKPHGGERANGTEPSRPATTAPRE